MLIINDIHICPNRTGGTTPQSQQALRDYVRENLQRLLDMEDQEVTVNGDLFDNFTVDIAEVIKTYDIFAKWLDSGTRTLNLIQGNHDSSERAGKVSSFHTLCHFLTARFGGRVRVFDSGLGQLNGRVWCISHVPNQSIFDLELDKVIGMDGNGKYLLLHCNYRNTFAENSDHSLNLNDEHVANLMRAGWLCVLGHEHVGYELRGGRVIVVGNQFPTSISDCIDDPFKHALRISDEGPTLVRTWDHINAYIETDWRNLGDLDGYQFIRVTGDATAAEAAEVIKVIASLRQQSDAYVIANAVRIEGHDLSGEEAAVTVEDIRAFDIVGEIMKELSPEEVEVVKELLK